MFLNQILKDGKMKILGNACLKVYQKEEFVINRQQEKKNCRFRYRIYKNDILISRKELKEYLCFSQSYTDSLIRRAANGENIPVFINNNIKIIDIKKGQQTI